MRVQRKAVNQTATCKAPIIQRDIETCYPTALCHISGIPLTDIICIMTSRQEIFAELLASPSVKQFLFNNVQVLYLFHCFTCHATLENSSLRNVTQNLLRYIYCLNEKKIKVPTKFIWKRLKHCSFTIKKKINTGLIHSCHDIEIYNHTINYIICAKEFSQGKLTSTILVCTTDTRSQLSSLVSSHFTIAW